MCILERDRHMHMSATTELTKKKATIILNLDQIFDRSYRDFSLARNMTKLRNAEHAVNVFVLGRLVLRSYNKSIVTKSAPCIHGLPCVKHSVKADCK